MNNKHFLILLILLIVVLIFMARINARISNLELALSRDNGPMRIYNQNHQHNFSINIEKVEGYGHAFGDNNKIENTLI
jgi:hypothetical protein